MLSVDKVDTVMIIQVVRTIRRVINNNKIRLIKKQFESSSIIGKDFSCTDTARCYNYTKVKGNIVIGNNVEILGTLIAEENGKISIGDNTTIRGNSRIAALESIEIGNQVIISNNVVICDNNNHPTDPTMRQKMSNSGFYSDYWEAKHSEKKKVVICDNVWIGERSTILKGVTIGRGSIVATCAVVTKDVPEYAIVAGNPAKVVKYLK